MNSSPTSDDVKNLTKALEKVVQELSVLNHNQSQRAKIETEIVAGLERIRNELHNLNYWVYTIKQPTTLFPPSPPQLTTGD